jgi:hypothetical protein
MERPMTRAALLDWVRRERAGWELLLAEVGEARMAAPGAMGAWTFKDLLIHLTAWQQHEQAPLERALAGERPAPPWPAGLDPHRDQDRINQFVYEATRDRPLAEVLREGRRTWDRLEEGLAALPEAALTDPHHFAWLGGEALGPSVVRDVTAHFHQDHEADLRAWLAGRHALEQVARERPSRDGP